MPATAASRRDDDLVHCRKTGRARDDALSFRHRDESSPQWDLPNKGPRAVDWIDNPAPTRIRLRHAELFTHDSIERETRCDPVASDTLRRAIGNRDR